MKNFLLTFSMFLAACLAYAQVPAGYYDQAEGKSGTLLKSSLHDIIKGHVTFPYTSTGTDTWDILKEADRDPNNPNNVLGIYSQFSMNGAAEYDNGAGWSREHVWAKSRGDFGTTRGAGTDLHHLRAADVSTNSARNNRNFDECTTPYVDNAGNYSGPTPSYVSDTEWTWEPPAQVKGDIARILFYMTVRYEGTDGEPDLELQETYLSNTSKEPFHARLSTLVAWHLADPVDSEEIRRNDVIYSYQQNRNPFIDRPEFVCLLFPEECGTTNTAPFFTSTPVLAAAQDQLYNYTITTDDLENDPMTISATTLPSWMTFQDNGNGTADLMGIPGANDGGSNNVVLTVTDGSSPAVSQSFTIEVTPTSTGGGGGNATELFFSEYIEGSSYNKALEIANFTGSPVNLSSYSIYKQTNGAGSWSSQLQLSGTLAEGDVYVVAHSSSASAMLAQADITTTAGAVTFNGNDAIALFKDGQLIDVIGTFNSTASFGANVTLVRKSSVTSPSSTYDTNEWDLYASDTFSYLGDHTIDGGGSGPGDPGTPSVVTISESYFETGWDGWSDGGSDAARYSGNFSAEGSYSIRIRDNSGTASSTTSPVLDLSAFDEVTISFSFYANSMENNEDFWLRYYDGSSYTTVQTYVSGTDFGNGSFYTSSVTLSKASYQLAANARFRFQCDASGNNDQIYIDEVVITGTTGTTSARLASNQTVLLRTLQSEPAEIVEEQQAMIALYPNPVVNQLTVEVPDSDQEYRFLLINMEGKVLIDQVISDLTKTQFDLTTFDKGIYVYQIYDGEEVQTGKVLKQ